MPDVAVDATIVATRARLLALAEAHARGELSVEDYETARRAAERSLSDAVLAAPPAPVAPPVARPSPKLVALLAVIVLAIAGGGYALTGAPSLAGLTAPPATPVPTADRAPTGSEREIGMQQIAGMVDALATRLKDRPDDAEGWTMLARSYTVLERYAEALPAYRRAQALQPANAGLLADYADAMAASRGGRHDAESLALIDHALALDPNQPKALALAGTVAFDAGDYAKAVTQWQKIADALPPDSDFHRQVVANIDEAKRRGGLAAATPPPSRKTAPSAAGAEALTGTVTLAPALAGRVSPGDTVFVLARAEGVRMPLAVFRATVGELPLTFRLDDSMAMTPTSRISDAKRIVVAARVSKSGNAITQPGDLGGETGPVAPGTRGLSIEIAGAVPAR